jgi:putative ABC transport system permease protein
LLNSLNDNVVMGMAQAAAAIALCLAVVVLCHRFAVHVERETALSLARGLVQMVAVGVSATCFSPGSLKWSATAWRIMSSSAPMTKAVFGMNRKSLMASSV